MSDLSERLREMRREVEALERFGPGEPGRWADEHGDWITRPGVLAILDRHIAALDAQPVGLDELAAALHATALRNHNLGEGPQRAICDSVESHRPRAEAILAALASEPQP